MFLWKRVSMGTEATSLWEAFIWEQKAESLFTAKAVSSIVTLLMEE